MGLLINLLILVVGGIGSCCLIGDSSALVAWIVLSVWAVIGFFCGWIVENPR